MAKDYEYSTSFETSLLIAQALNDILFWERMEKLMPLVAEELMKKGVDFSKVDYQELPSEANND